MKNRPAQSSSRLRTSLVCLALFALSWLVFGQTLEHRFVNYDDNVYVYENPLVTEGLTWRGVAAAFSESHARNWHPLTTLSHMLDCELYGIAPRGHHATNVLLHSLGSLLLFLLLRNMTGAFWRTAFVAALFAIHPLRVESVAWIAERKDLLSGVFFFLTLGAYVHYCRAPSLVRFVAVLLAFACGLMSKPMLVTLPFLLLLLDYWPLRRLRLGREENAAPIALRRVLLEKVPLLALSVAAAAITFVVQKRVGYQADDLPLLWRINNAVVAYVTYLWQMVWPANLAPLYPHPRERLLVWQVARAAALLLAITAVVLRWRRARPYLSTGWFWYVGMLVPVIGVVDVGAQAHADRYTYLPQIGLYVCIAWAAAELVPRIQYRPQVLAAGAAIVIASLAAVAWRQTTHWRDSERLWSHALAVTKDNDIAHLNLGEVYFRQGEMDRALAHFRTALELRSRRSQSRYDFPLAAIHSSLGSVLHRKGRVAEAIEHFRQAIRSQPDYTQAYVNLASALAETGEARQAIATLRQALVERRGDAQAQIALATLLLETGEMAEAVALYEHALETAPSATTPLNDLAWIYATSADPSLHNPGRAVILAERAMQTTKGTDPLLLHKLAAAYAAAGRFTEAAQAAERGLQLATEPKDAGLAAELKRNMARYRSGLPLSQPPAR